MYRLLVLLLMIIISSSTNSFCQSALNSSPVNQRIVGYYFLRAAANSGSDTLTNSFFPRVTHLNIAFVNPDSSGRFRDYPGLASLIARAHKHGVKVLASIGGGGSHAYYGPLLQQQRRAAFIKELLSMARKYKFDGIDVDLEGSDIDVNYEPFVIELAHALKQENKLITAAIATAYKDQLSDKAIQQFNFVNIMSYDATGPWAPLREQHHSPYDMAEFDLNYWGSTRGLSKDKMVLGVPFYGYGFSKQGSEVVSLNYKDIIGINASYAVRDTVTIMDSLRMYFNGKETIRKKTRLAKDRASGIMIWQLFGDASGSESLLDVINSELRPAVKK